MDLDVALPKTDDPDSVFHGTYHHVSDVWGSRYGNAPKKVSFYYEAARTALQQRDYDGASEAVGLLAHYYADICNPLRTDQVPAEVRMHSKYENAAQKHTHAPDEYESWVTFDGVTPVSDPTSFTVRAATKAHRDYAKLVSTFNRRGFNATVRAIAIRSLNRAANGLADLIVALGRAAPPPRPSPSPSISPSPSPTVTPPASPSPTPTRVLSVSGSVSDSSPAQYSNVTAYCKAVDQRGMAISGVRVTFTWHYTTTSPAETWLPVRAALPPARGTSAARPRAPRCASACPQAGRGSTPQRARASRRDDGVERGEAQDAPIGRGEGAESRRETLVRSHRVTRPSWVTVHGSESHGERTPLA